MKKFILPFIALVFLSVAAISWTHKFDGAVVISDQGCTLLDGDGGFAVADSDHSVITPSDNAKLTCKVSGVPNSSGKAVRYSYESLNIGCNIVGAGVSTDWQEVVSASGNATLQCRIQ
jgi:hypothetical protein